MVTSALNINYLTLALSRTDVFGKVFMPDHCYRPCVGPMRLLVDTLDHPKYMPSAAARGLAQSRTAIAAPRGIGKTTTCSLVFPARKILSGQSHYVVMIGASLDMAIEMSENLKDVIFNTPEIVEVFGPEEGEEFSKKVWEVKIGRKEDGTYSHICRILPLGPGGKIRGRKFGSRRPDLIILDDIENDKNVKSEMQRGDLTAWLQSAVLNTVGRDRSWQVIYPGTVMRHDSLLSELLNPEKSPLWASVRISVCTPEYTSLYPDFMTTEQVMEMADDYRRRGELSIFAREMMSLPTNPEEQAFKEEYFQPYSEADEHLSNRRDVVNFVLIDPARSTKEGNCNTAIVGVAVNPLEGIIYVREIVSRRMSPDELYQEAFDMYDRLGACVMGVEITGLEEYIKQPLQTIASRRGGKGYNFVWVRPRDKKEARPGALLPYYKQGHVKHNPACCRLLEARLIEWPACAAWDEIDAYELVIPVMEEGNIYFDSVMAYNEEEDERMFDKLMQEDELEFAELGDWRAW